MNLGSTASDSHTIGIETKIVIISLKKKFIISGRVNSVISILLEKIHIVGYFPYGRDFNPNQTYKAIEKTNEK